MSKTIISSAVAELIHDLDGTAKSAIRTLAEIYAHYQVKGLAINGEEDFQAILNAVVTRDYVVDTGMFYVNIGKPLGLEEFLCVEAEEIDGEIKYHWYFDSFDNAVPFTKETLETQIPEALRSEAFVMAEYEALDMYSKAGESLVQKVEIEENTTPTESTEQLVEEEEEPKEVNLWSADGFPAPVELEG